MNGKNALGGIRVLLDVAGVDEIINEIIMYSTQCDF
jgi:hypothetical protein